MRRFRRWRRRSTCGFLRHLLSHSFRSLNLGACSRLLTLEMKATTSTTRRTACFMASFTSFTYHWARVITKRPLFRTDVMHVTTVKSVTHSSGCISPCMPPVAVFTTRPRRVASSTEGVTIFVTAAFIHSTTGFATLTVVSGISSIVLGTPTTVVMTEPAVVRMIAAEALASRPTASEPP